MTGLCMAGAPDSEGRGGCRAWDGRQPAECSSRSRLCDFDLEVAERDVRALTLDYRDLEQLLPPALGVWGDGMPRGKSSPLPLRGDILDLQMQIHWLVDAWADVVRDVDRLSAKPAGAVREGWAVEQAVNILAPRLHRLAGLESPVTMLDYPGGAGEIFWLSGEPHTTADVPGWQGVLDLAQLHQRARRALGLTQEKPSYCQGVPCRNPDCDLKTLYRLPGKDDVQCFACGLVYDAEDYSRWLKLLAASVPRNVIPAA